MPLFLLDLFYYLVAVTNSKFDLCVLRYFMKIFSRIVWWQIILAWDCVRCLLNFLQDFFALHLTLDQPAQQAQSAQLAKPIKPVEARPFDQSQKSCPPYLSCQITKFSTSLLCLFQKQVASNLKVGYLSQFTSLTVFFDELIQKFVNRLYIMYILLWSNF